MSEAKALIERLGLEPHPEGGWYRETYRAPAAKDERASATAIHFLLEKGQYSHWHRVDAAEMWFWHAGDPLELRLAQTSEHSSHSITLGPDVLDGHSVQHVIPPDWWQAARPLEQGSGYTLVSCVVSPGFEFSGFELAAEGWEPGS